MKPIPILAASLVAAALTSPALAATATPADTAFVAKVSQRGMAVPLPLVGRYGLPHRAPFLKRS